MFIDAPMLFGLEAMPALELEVIRDSFYRDEMSLSLARKQDPSGRGISYDASTIPSARGHRGGLLCPRLCSAGVVQL